MDNQEKSYFKLLNKEDAECFLKKIKKQGYMWAGRYEIKPKKDIEDTIIIYPAYITCYHKTKLITWNYKKIIFENEEQKNK